MRIFALLAPVVIATLAGCAPGPPPPVPLTQLQPTATLSLDYDGFSNTVTATVVPGIAGCPTLPSDAGATLDGVPMAPSSRGGSLLDGGCAPLTFELGCPNSAPTCPFEALLDEPTTTVELTDSSANWRLTAVNLLASRTISWSPAPTGAVEPGQSLSVQYLPSTDLPNTTSIIMLGASDLSAYDEPSDDVWIIVLRPNGGIAAQGSLLGGGPPPIALDAGYRWDAESDRLNFVWPPQGARFEGTPATLAFLLGSPVEVPLTTCSGPASCEASYVGDVSGVLDLSVALAP